MYKRWIKRQPAVQKAISCECKTEWETSRETKEKVKIPEKERNIESWLKSQKNECENKFYRLIGAFNIFSDDSVFAVRHLKSIHRQQRETINEEISRVFKQWLQWRQFIVLDYKWSANARRISETRKLSPADEAWPLSCTSAEMEVNYRVIKLPCNEQLLCKISTWEFPALKLCNLLNARKTKNFLQLSTIKTSSSD